MKKYFILSLSIIMLSALSLQGEKKMNENIISSKPENVTLFLNGAQITRKGKISVPNGESTVRFTNLPYALNPESIQVQTSNNQRIISAVHSINYLSEAQESEKIKSLQAEYEKLKYEKKFVEAERTVLKNEWDILMVNKDFNKKESVKVEDFKDAVDFFKKSMTEISKKQIECEKELEKIREKIEAIEMEFGNISKQKAVSEISVEIYSETESECEIFLTYYTPNASWTPMYDIRTESDSLKASLVMKANVKQNTGEDWDNVNVILSSGNPLIGATEPRLTPWRLGFEIPNNTYLKQSQVNFMRQSSESKKVMDEVIDEINFETESYLPAPSAATENQSSLEFILTNKVNILSHQQKTLDVAIYNLQAKYKYYSVRKLDMDVFLLAVISGWENLNLLAGSVNIFLENSFVGKTYLDPRLIKGDLELSLGRDKQVTVTRVKGTDYKSKTMLGSNIKESRNFDINVRNLKKKSIEITVIDQAPISTDKSIVVEVLETSGGVFDKETGELSWNLTLEPSASKNMKFKYSVTYPKDKTLILE